MRQICLLLIILFSISVKAQTRAFISANDKFTKDPRKAVSYVIISKLEGDSAYYVEKYNMQDSIMMTGFFKDSNLVVANGRFHYYNIDRFRYDVKLNPIKNKYDTILRVPQIYLESSGVYLNNLKTGAWIEYKHFATDTTRDLIITQYSYYHDNKLNGIYKSMYDSVHVKETGQYIDDKKSGEWVQFNWAGDTVKINYYKKDLLTKSIYPRSKQFKGGVPNYNFGDYLAGQLANRIMEPKDYVKTVWYGFILDTLGKLTKPDIIYHSYFDLDNNLIKEITNAPEWQPLLRNNVPCKGSILVRLEIDIEDRKIVHVKYLNDSIMFY